MIVHLAFGTRLPHGAERHRDLAERAPQSRYAPRTDHDAVAPVAVGDLNIGPLPLLQIRPVGNRRRFGSRRQGERSRNGVKFRCVRSLRPGPTRKEPLPRAQGGVNSTPASCRRATLNSQIVRLMERSVAAVVNPTITRRFPKQWRPTMPKATTVAHA